MPRETFSGGDGDGTDSAKKRPALGRFGLAPDVNIRDVFWRIMASYMAAKKPGTDLRELDNDRIALVRVALSVLNNPNPSHSGMSPRFVTLFTMTMLLDAGWDDAFAEFLSGGFQGKAKARKDIAHVIGKLQENGGHAKTLAEWFTAMLRNRETNAMALGYVADVGSEALALAIKKELIIFARGDIGENQRNAIKAATLIKDDTDVRKSLIVILSHWDAEARLAAADALAGAKDESGELAKAVEKRMAEETDERVKQALKRILL